MLPIRLYSLYSPAGFTVKCPDLMAFKYFPDSSSFNHPDIQTAVFADHCIMFKQTECIFTLHNTFMCKNANVCVYDKF